MSIKPKLLLTLFALAIIPLLLLGITCYYFSKGELQRSKIASLEILAEHKARTITNFIEEQKRIIQTLKSSIVVNKNLPTLVRYAQDRDHPHFVKATENLNHHLRNLQSIFPLDDIVLTDSQGTILYLSNLAHIELWMGNSLPIEDIEALQNGGTLNYFKNEHEDGAFGLLMTEPVHLADGSVLGTVALEVNISSIHKLISENSGLGETGFTVLSKRASEQSYLYLTANHKTGKPPSEPVPFKEDSSPMQEAVQGRSGSGISLSCEGDKILSAWQHIPYLEMGLVSRIGLNEAFASIRDMRSFILFVIAFALAFACGMALMIYQYISTPILSLQKGARQIGCGNLTYRLNSKRKDEFGSLAHTFDEMARNLQGVTATRDELNEKILEREKAEHALQKERTFLQDIINGVLDPIMVIATDYKVLMMNESARNNLPTSAPPNQNWLCHQASHHVDHPCTGENHPCPLQEVQKTGKEVIMTHRHPGPDGEIRIHRVQASPLWNDDGTLLGIIESSTDITQRVELLKERDENQQRLTYLAHHDALTKLPNRWLFSDRLQQALAKANRSGSKVAMMLLDLDRFKTINDTLGHPIGDEVLQEVAKRLQTCLRETDTLARLGGDEFLILLEEVEDVSQLVSVASKINLCLSQPIKLSEIELTVTSSIGISLFPTDAVDAEGLFKCADVAMYQAKKLGRNTYQFFTLDMNKQAHDRLYLEGELRKALELDQFTLFYQPQCDMRTGQILGVEALLRWHHPERGLVSPADFIPLAEETGLIVPIGEWCLRTASRQNKEWQNQGHPPMVMAVNISARQFRQQGFIDLVDTVLTETCLEPKWLELEITESIIMENVDEAILTLTDLKARGLHLAIDDFGTGYSSLSYLKKFPIDKLKIDRSFVIDIANNSSDAAIATSVIDLAKNMGMEVIAEGVETFEQRDFLIKKDCYQGQGYLYSKPLPATEIGLQLGSNIRLLQKQPHVSG